MPFHAEPRSPVPAGLAGPQQRLDALIARLLQGRGGALAITGGPGAGKTALLAWLTSRSPHLTVLATTGLPAESDLPFAALGDLLRPLLPRLPSLPRPQAEALGAALALSAPGGRVDAYAVRMATLTLLAAAAGRRPVLVVVDDAASIDRPSAAALLFAARRVDSVPVAIVLAARDPSPPEFAAAGLETLVVGGPDPDALDRLTPRELQVARAVADGLSNPEAAAALFVSRKTVETHLSSTYRKLGVRSRTQLVRYLAEAGVSGSSPRAERM